MNGYEIVKFVPLAEQPAHAPGLSPAFSVVCFEERYRVDTVGVQGSTLDSKAAGSFAEAVRIAGVLMMDRQPVLYTVQTRG